MNASSNLPSEPRKPNYGGDSAILHEALREWWVVGVMGKLESTLIRLNVAPTTITWIGFSITCFVAWLFYQGHFFAAGWLLLLAGSFDFLDGRVARATGQVSQAGAYLDSVTDRYSDALLFLGLAGYYYGSVISYFALAAVVGSFLVSYTKARAANFGVDCSVGLMQRAERFAYLGFGAVISSYITIALMPFYGPPHRPPQHLLILVIVALGVMTNVTAVQRIRFTVKALNQEGGQNQGNGHGQDQGSSSKA